MKITISVFSFFYAFISFAQTGGEHVYSFLNFTTSARQTALGGSVLTFTDNVNQPLWNPGTINADMHGKVSVNYVNYLADISYASTSYAHKISERLGTFHSGITYLNYGEMIGADEDGNETGAFKAYEMAFSVGYAYAIPNSSFRVGVNAKVVNSVIEQFSSLGIATDIGVLYQNDEKPYRFALVARNLGFMLKSYDGTRESLPFQVQLGGSYQPAHVPVRLYTTIDNLQQFQLAYFNPSDQTTDFFGTVTKEEPSGFSNISRHFVFGAELFPEKRFNLRMGYNVQRAVELRLKEIRTFSGLSFGFGLKVKRYKLNYSYSKYHPVSDSHSFALLIDL